MGASLSKVAYQLGAVLAFILCLNTAFGQTDDTFTDARDGEVYPVVSINGKHWLGADLRFQTEDSFCPKFNKRGYDCSERNFYPNTDLKTVCPDDWHVATISDWKDYLNHISDSSTVFKVDSFYQFEGSKMINLTLMTTMNLELFQEDNPLDLKAFGWVQNKRIRNKRTLTYWIAPVDVVDSKFHVHASNKKYIYHSHKHNIEDVPRKRRMFGVRCVEDE